MCLFTLNYLEYELEYESLQVLLSLQLENTYIFSTHYGLNRQYKASLCRHTKFDLYILRLSTNDQKA